MFKPRHPGVHGQGAREARGRGDDRRGRRVDRADAGQAQVGHGARGAHARLGRRPAGQRARPVARARARARQPDRASTRELRLAGAPRGVRGRATSRAITDAKTQQVLPQLGSVALQSGEHAGRDDRAARSRARRRSRSSTTTRARWRRSGAARPSCRCSGGRTMKGKTAQLAWGTVHLALLPTNEDRAKAVVDWAGRGADAPALGPDHRRHEDEPTSGGTADERRREFFDELGGAGTSRCSRRGERHDALRDRRRQADRALARHASTRATVAVSRKNARPPTAPSARTRTLFDGMVERQGERDGGGAARRDRRSRATPRLARPLPAAASRSATSTRTAATMAR